MKYINLIIIFQISLIFIFCQEETSQNSSNNPEYDLSKLYKFNCTNSNIDCSGNGICSEDGLRCECNTGYQTFYERGRPNPIYRGSRGRRGRMNY